MSKLLVNKDKMSYLLRDLTMQVLIYSAIVCVSGVFLWILFDLIRGGSALLSWQFLTDVPRDAGRAGGISSILASTLLVLLIALLAALPISWATAVMLTEFVPAESPFGRWVRYSLQVLACVPQHLWVVRLCVFQSLPESGIFHFIRGLTSCRVVAHSCEHGGWIARSGELLPVAWHVMQRPVPCCCQSLRPPGSGIVAGIGDGKRRL